MFRFLYSTLTRVAAPLALTATAWRGIRDRSYRDRLLERLGYTQLRFASAPIWMHAVSVGEVQAAIALVRSIQLRWPDIPLLITTATPTGAGRVRAAFGESVQHGYLPYDTPGSVRRFLARVHPQLAIIMETEIWPNLYRECGKRGLPIIIANARLSEKSVRRFKRFNSVFKEILTSDVVIAAQSATDAQRFIDIGAAPERVHLVGNIKFDLHLPDHVRARGEKLRRSRFPGRSVWVAGSTHEGEEQQLLKAHESVRLTHRNALLLIVPRHPRRFGYVRSLVRSRSFAFASRAEDDEISAQTEVLVVDTVGELLTMYAAADVAFVGGSLVPIGGHNLLEPAVLARPILIGPHNFNAPEVARLFLAEGAALQVDSATELARCVNSLFSDEHKRRELGEKASALVAANRGAVNRVVQLIESHL